jgi:hypothetical protein
LFKFLDLDFGDIRSFRIKLGITARDGADGSERGRAERFGDEVQPVAGDNQRCMS